MYISVVITAGGTGRRMKSSIPKQFIGVAGKPLIVHTIEKFNNLESVNEIIVVVPEKDAGGTEQLIKEWNLNKVTAVVHGGAERFFSVKNGISSVSGNADIILIHDGVRPLVTTDDILGVIDKTAETGAAILALPVTDTIKRVEHGKIVNTMNRSIMWRAQTPQGFRTDIIKEAYETAAGKGITATDDSQLAEAAGVCVSVVRGSGPNIKVTNPDDIPVVSFLISAEEK